MGYGPVGDGVPDEWGICMYDTVLFLAAAIDSMLWKGVGSSRREQLAAGTDSALGRIVS